MTSMIERTTFEISRTSEYFSLTELQAMTGQPMEHFASVIVKEVLDNSLDACESAPVRPEIQLAVCRGEDKLSITIEDNGPGIPAETVQRILAFQTRTSDKLAYRAPTRGAQGNALKTVLGIPFALGSNEPVIIEGRGIKHQIRAWIDPAGELHIDHREEPALSRVGTKVQVHLPVDQDSDEKLYQDFDPQRWAQAFSLFNPHASVKICILENSSKLANNGNRNLENRDFYNSYQPTIEFPGQWRKFLPTDFTSPWWYTSDILSRLVFLHIADAKKGGRDLTLREFVCQFRGLSGNSASKAVCRQFPGINRLGDFEDDGAMVDALLEAMKKGARPPSPAVLGEIGAGHFKDRLQELYGIKGPDGAKRFWYKSVNGVVGDIPFVFEVALAETERPGPRVYHGINFSPTFQDPLANTCLECTEFISYGFDGFISQGSGASTGHGTTVIAAVHLVCPGLEFLDRGKTRLKVPKEMANKIAEALWSPVKVLYKEAKQREKDAAKARRLHERAIRERRREAGLKEAVFHVMDAAWAHASDDGRYPVSSRFLYYPVRKLIQELTSKVLNFNYFSQDLLVEYQAIYGPLEGLYYESRGVFTSRIVGRGWS